MAVQELKPYAWVNGKFFVRSKSVVRVKRSPIEKRVKSGKGK